MPKPKPCRFGHEWHVVVTKYSPCEPHPAQPCACGAVLWKDREPRDEIHPLQGMVIVRRASDDIPVWVDPGGHG